jgi:hypothetical protein
MSNETLIVITNPYYDNGTKTIDASPTEVRVGLKFYPFNSSYSIGYDSNELLYEILDYNIKISDGENILTIDNNEESINNYYIENLETIYAILGRDSIIRFRNEINSFSPSTSSIRAWLLLGGTSSVITVNSIYYIGNDSNSVEYSEPIDYTGTTIALGLEGDDNDTEPPFYYYTVLYNLCMHSDTMIKLGNGESKMVKDLVKGDMIMTDEGPKPLAKLIKSSCNKVEFVKISKNCFGKNIPSNDIYLTPEHSLGIYKEKNEKGNKYTHLSVKELVNNMKGIKYEIKETDNVYNLVFNDQYNINICDIKVLTHHPNHENGKYKLLKSDETDNEKRSEQKYVNNDKKFFNYITFKQLISKKPENMKGSEHIRNSVKF